MGFNSRSLFIVGIGYFSPLGCGLTRHLIVFTFRTAVLNSRSEPATYFFIAAAIFAFISGGIFGNKNASCNRMLHDDPASG